MNRVEIIEGLKQIYYRVCAIMYYRKTLEACLKLLENENALIDQVLEIIDTQLEALADGKYGGASALNYVYEAVLALKGGEQGNEISD